MEFSPQLMPARPPYISFERRPVETRDAVGNVNYIDVNFALITQPGSKDRTEKIADEWFARIKVEAQRGQYPKEWYNEFFQAYQLWKTDQIAPLNGFDIRNWPAASPAEIKNLTNLGLMTVEDVAAMNEEVVMRYGMGARSLKQRATDFLQIRKDQAPLIAEMDSMRRTMELMQARMVNLEQANQQLTQQLAVQSGPTPMFSQSFQPRDLDTRLSEAQTGISLDREISKGVDETIDEELS